MFVRNGNVFLKKSFSLILALMLALSVAVTGVYAEDAGNAAKEEVIAFENFESVSGYEINDAFGGNVLSVATLANAAVEEGKLKLQATYGEAWFYARWDNGVKENVIAEFKFMQPESKPFTQLFEITDSTSVAGAKLCIDDGGWISGGGKELLSCSPNQWYSVKLVVDAENATYDVYIDNNLCGSDIPFAGSANTEGIRQITIDGLPGCGIMYYDDIKITLSTKAYTGHDLIKEKLLYEDFSNAGNYNVDENFGGDRFKIASIGNAAAENGMLKLSPPSGSEAWLYAQTETPVTGKIVAECKFMQPEKSAVSQLFEITDSSASRGTKVLLDGDYIRTSKGGHIQYAANRWYNIKLVIDADSKKFDFYIDGTLYSENEAFSDNTGDLCRLVMNSAVGGKNVYYDDIKIYRPYNGIDVLLSENFAQERTIANGDFIGGALKTVSGGGTADSALKINDGGWLYADVVEGSKLADAVNNEKNLVVEFDFTQPEASPLGMLYAAGGYVGANVVDAIKIKISDGKFYCQSADSMIPFLTATKKNEPYVFRIYIDSKNKNYDVYADGVLCAENISFVNPNVESLSRIFKTDGGGCKGYSIDNLDIYTDTLANAAEKLIVSYKQSGDMVELLSSIDGYDIIWESMDKNLIADDGTITPSYYNETTYLVANVINDGRSFSRKFNVLVLAPAGLGVDYDSESNIVKAQAYYPGRLCIKCENPSVAVAVYNEKGALAAVKVGGREGDFCKAELNVSELPAGDYTAKAFLFTDISSLTPLDAAPSQIFQKAPSVVEAKYDDASKTLTFWGSGRITNEINAGEYADKAEKIVIGKNITAIDEGALSAFGKVSVIEIPENVAEIGNNALPSGDYKIRGYKNSEAEKYASDNGKNFVLKGLRVLSVGNSHTYDYTRWIGNIQNDLYEAGLKTEISHEYIVAGGRQLYRNDGTALSHLTIGSDSSKPGNYEYINMLGSGKKWDLVILQDWHESSLDNENFAEGLGNAVKWVKSLQPNAKIVWAEDWADKDSIRITSQTSLEGVFSNITAAVNAVEAMSENKPDAIFPMGTAVQNARTSYLGAVNNAKDAYTNLADTDWAQSNLQDYTVLERDVTHLSHELGRYTVGAAVYAGIYSMFENNLDKPASFDFYNALKTAPVTSGAAEWKGEFNDSIWSIVKESARNAYIRKNGVTNSVYTVDPADEAASAMKNANYSAVDFSDKNAIAVAASNSSGLKIEAEDIEVSGNTAKITFLLGYTKKTVDISK